MSIIKVKKGQNVYDICLQEFGTLENMFDILLDNSLEVNSLLNSSQELVINNTGKGDERVKTFVNLNNLSYNNNQGVSLPPLVGGDYNDDYSNDYY